MSTVQTQNSSSVSHPVQRATWSRLALAGLVAVIGSVIVNTLIRLIALALLPIPAGAMQLHVPMLVPIFTIVGSLGALLVFALMNRFARNPTRLFRIVATVVLVISLIPDFLLLATPMANITSVATLVVLHITTYLICVGAFTSNLLTRKQ